MTTIPQLYRDRQTDGRTDNWLVNTALRYASRGNNRPIRSNVSYSQKICVSIVTMQTHAQNHFHIDIGDTQADTGDSHSRRSIEGGVEYAGPGIDRPHWLNCAHSSIRRVLNSSTSTILERLIFFPQNTPVQMLYSAT